MNGAPEIARATRFPDWGVSTEVPLTPLAELIEDGSCPLQGYKSMSSVATKRGSDLRTLILQTLDDGSYSPLELLRHLQTAEVTESALKNELAQLIEERVIELSADRHIRVR